MQWIERLNAPLSVPFIKSFLCVTENDCETYNPPNYGYAAMVITSALLFLLVFHSSYKNT